MRDETISAGARGRPVRPVTSVALAAAALALFLVWSNSFIAMSYLVGREGVSASFGWLGLTVARFLPAALVCAIYCFGFRRRESIAMVSRHCGRLVCCGLLAVPCYNFAIYAGIERGVPAPVASLTTALLPLFVIVLARIFLRERITRRQLAGFVVAVSGLLVIASGRRFVGGTGEGSFALALAITALGPLSWSIFSLVGQPVMRSSSSLLWTFLSIVAGTLPLLAVAPWVGIPEMLKLAPGGWLALLYLSIPCTVLGYAAWSWLLKHLRASTVGLTVFLNPPLTTLSKLALQALFPATFLFTVGARDLVGGAIALTGLAIAILSLPDP